MRRLLPLLLVVATACTTRGDCGVDVNVDNETRVLGLDRATGDIVWSTPLAWTPGAQALPVGGGVAVVSRTGTGREVTAYDEDGAPHDDLRDRAEQVAEAEDRELEEAGRPVPDEEDPTEGYPRPGEGRRARWERLAVGTELSAADKALVDRAASLPAGPLRERALGALSLRDVHSDLWFTRPRATAAFRDGRVAWRREVLSGRPLTTRDSAPEGIAVLHQHDRLLGVRVADGSPVWRRTSADGWSDSALVTAAGLVVAEAAPPGDEGGNGTGRLHLVDIASGRSRWTTPVEGQPAVVVRDGGAVVVGTSVRRTVDLATSSSTTSTSETWSGQVTHVDLATGRPAWVRALPEGPVVGAVALRSRVAVVLSDPRVGCD